MAATRSATSKAMPSSTARARCAGVGAQREAEEGAARRRVPVRRAEAGEGGHEDPALAGPHLRRELARPARTTMITPRPSRSHADGRAADEGAALEGERRRRRRAAAATVVSSRWREATGSRAGVDQQEAAGAVGDLRLAGAVAALAEQRRLLVAAQRRRWAALRRTGRASVSPITALVSTTLGSSSRGTPNSSSSSSSQSPRVRCRRAACARRWSRRSRAAAPPVRFQTSHESTVPKASSPRRRAPQAVGDVVQDPAQLGRREVGVEHETRLAPHQRARGRRRRSARHAPAVRRSCQTIAGATGRPSRAPRRRWSRAGWRCRRPRRPPPRRRRPRQRRARRVELRLPRSRAGPARPSPAAGRSGRLACCATATMRPSWSTSTCRELVVPWSSARIIAGRARGAPSWCGALEGRFAPRPSSRVARGQPKLRRRNPGSAPKAAPSDSATPARRQALAAAVPSPPWAASQPRASSQAR